MTTKLIYLASPYSHPMKRVREDRVVGVCVAWRELSAAGHLVFSPIAHSVVIEQHLKTPTTWDFWQALDCAILDRCDELWVLKLPGWQESTGVSAEIQRARAKGMEVRLIEPSAAVLKAMQEAA